MSQDLYTKRHKEKNPNDESLRKERQRRRDDVLRFHIRRNRISGIAIPPSVDQSSDAFMRVQSEYSATLKEEVEVVS